MREREVPSREALFQSPEPAVLDCELPVHTPGREFHRRGEKSHVLQELLPTWKERFTQVNSSLQAVKESFPAVKLSLLGLGSSIRLAHSQLRRMSGSYGLETHPVLRGRSPQARRCNRLRPTCGALPDREVSQLGEWHTLGRRLRTAGRPCTDFQSISICPNRRARRRSYGARNLFRFNVACCRAADSMQPLSRFERRSGLKSALPSVAASPRYAVSQTSSPRAVEEGSAGWKPAIQSRLVGRNLRYARRCAGGGTQAVGGLGCVGAVPPLLRTRLRMARTFLASGVVLPR